MRLFMIQYIHYWRDKILFVINFGKIGNPSLDFVFYFLPTVANCRAPNGNISFIFYFTVVFFEIVIINNDHHDEQPEETMDFPNLAMEA